MTLRPQTQCLAPSRNLAMTSSTRAFTIQFQRVAGGAGLGNSRAPWMDKAERLPRNVRRDHACGTAVTEGPLPTDVLTAIDDAALKAQPKWPPYFYGV